MMKLKRYLIVIAALLALAGFGAQIVHGIATGTASQCSVSGSCATSTGR
jgi:ABC-type proline/glycine betaine transport system permease subunit